MILTFFSFIVFPKSSVVEDYWKRLTMYISLCHIFQEMPYILFFLWQQATMH